jgi:diadenosine tetraphosphate (Ap4A) HIT family hydrolase
MPATRTRTLRPGSGRSGVGHTYDGHRGRNARQRLARRDRGNRRWLIAAISNARAIGCNPRSELGSVVTMPADQRAYLDEAAYLNLVRRACFSREMLAGNLDYAHHVAYHDDAAVVSLNRFPSLLGHVLVAPIEHRRAGGRRLRTGRVPPTAARTGTALTQLVPTERLYVLSLGSQQGNRHVHWHVAPLPPGTRTTSSRSARSRSTAAISTCPMPISPSWPPRWAGTSHACSSTSCR